MIHRDNLQPVAWAVLLGAFGLFFLAIVGGPLGARRFVQQATVPQRAVVEARSGTVTISDGLSGMPLTELGEGQALAEGWSVTTSDEVSTAFLRFDDGGLGVDQPGSTITLSPFTSLTLNQMRRPRFQAGQVQPATRVEAQALAEEAGGLTVGATWGERSFRVDLKDLEGTDLGWLILDPDSRARLDFIGPGRARVQALQGSVAVANGMGEVHLAADQRSEILAGGAPLAAESGPRSVLQDGSFDRLSSETVWDYGQRGPSKEGAPLGQVETASLVGGNSILRFQREGSEGSSMDLYFRQELGGPDPVTGDWRAVDVRRANSIRVTATLRVLNQSLAGGGDGRPESEYPLILRLRSIDRQAEDPDGCEWTVGFYMRPPWDDPNRVPANGVAVEPGQWFSFDSGNMLDESNPFHFRNRTPPCDRPTHLTRVEVGTSGHDFESEIEAVAVWVE